MTAREAGDTEVLAWPNAVAAFSTLEVATGTEPSNAPASPRRVWMIGAHPGPRIRRTGSASPGRASIAMGRLPVRRATDWIRSPTSRRHAAHSSAVSASPRSTARRVLAWPAPGALAIMATTGRDRLSRHPTDIMAQPARTDARASPETLLTPPARLRKATGRSRIMTAGSASARARSWTVQP